MSNRGRDITISSTELASKMGDPDINTDTDDEEMDAETDLEMSGCVLNAYIKHLVKELEKIEEQTNEFKILQRRIKKFRKIYDEQNEEENDALFDTHYEDRKVTAYADFIQKLNSRQIAA